MTEEENKDFNEWLASPEAGFTLAYHLISTHGGRIYFDTPETNGFPANRFAARLMGYMYALVSDRVKQGDEFRINVETVSPYATNEELVVFERVQQKVKEQKEKGVPPFDDGYVGLHEGMAIYINKEDISLLYSEVDIDLNKNCDDEGIPSYAYHRSHLKAGLQLAKCDRSRDDTIKILMNDGIAEKGATMIVGRMIEVIKQQRKKAAMKSFAIGSLILIVGLIITGLTYMNAVSNGGGRYILTWGALGVGAFYALSGITSYVKALNYRGQ